MSSAIPLSDDGDYSQLLETEGRTTEFPFLNAQVKDIATKLYRLPLEVNRLDYAPAAALSTHPDDAAAYLTDETPPPAIGGDVVRTVRTYANIPGTQISYGPSLLIAFPAVPESTNTAHTTFAIDSVSGFPTTLQTGALWLNRANGNYYAWTSTNRFYGAAVRVLPSMTAATGGTFTITYKSSTTAPLAWNATMATITTALNALADIVADGVVFNAGIAYGNNYLGNTANGSLWLRVDSGTLAQPLVFTSSLTPTAAAVVFPYYGSLSAGADIYFFIAIWATVTAHGYNPANLLAVITNTGIKELPSTRWSVIDVNTIAWGPTTSNAGDYVNVQRLAPFNRNYQPASRLIRTKNTTTFYLPGVTGGITTPGDIAVPADLQNAQDMLNAILTTTGFQVYQAEGPSTWQGPIVQLKTIAINLADLP
jgi:hypothetical protein